MLDRDEVGTGPLHRPIVFFGVPRSGSSIVSDAFMRHPDIAFASQYASLHPRAVRLNAARPLFDNGLWRILGTKRQLNRTGPLNRFAFRPGECYPLWDHLVGPAFAREFLLDRVPDAGQVRRTRRYFTALVKAQRRRRLALKITGPGRLAFLSGLFPDAVFVRIVREPLPTVRSLLQVDFWRQRTERVKWRGPYSPEEIAAIVDDPDDVFATALQIKKLLDTTESELASTGLEVLTVRYERFVQDPVDTMRRVLEHAGLPAVEPVLTFDGAFRVHERNADVEAFFSTPQLERLQGLFATGCREGRGSPLP